MLEGLKQYLPKAPLFKRRSGKWPAVRAKHLQENPKCAACGATKELEVHHIVPFHVDKTLELEPTNLITLCENKSYNCHFFVGHYRSWKKYNKKCKEAALKIYEAMKE